MNKTLAILKTIGCLISLLFVIVLAILYSLWKAIETIIYHLRHELVDDHTEHRDMRGGSFPEQAEGDK